MTQKDRVLQLKKRVTEESNRFSPDVKAFLYKHLNYHLNNTHHRAVSWYVDIAPYSAARIRKIYEHHLTVLRRYRLFEGIERLYMPEDALDILMFRHDHSGEISGIVDVLKNGHQALLQPTVIDGDWRSQEYSGCFCMKAPAHFNANGGGMFDDDINYSETWQIPVVLVTRAEKRNSTRRGSCASLYMPGAMRKVLRAGRFQTTEVVPIQMNYVERLRG